MIALVLLPGMDGTGLLFADFISALGPEFKTIVVAYPDDPSLGYDELELVARSALPHDRPFIVLGESFSGPIAISIAASKPLGLVGLILCCSFARNPRSALSWALPALRFIPATRVPTGLLRRYLLGRISSVRLRAAMREAQTLVSSKTLKARLRAIATVDVSTKLSHVGIPVLCLRAKKDLLVTRASCNHIAKMAPHVQVAELDGPHMLLQDMPSAAASVVIGFSRSAIDNSNRSQRFLAVDNDSPCARIPPTRN